MRAYTQVRTHILFAQHAAFAFVELATEAFLDKVVEAVAEGF